MNGVFKVPQVLKSVCPTPHPPQKSLPCPLPRAARQWSTREPPLGALPLQVGLELAPGLTLAAVAGHVRSLRPYKPPHHRDLGESWEDEWVDQITMIFNLVSRGGGGWREGGGGSEAWRTVYSYPLPLPLVDSWATAAPPPCERARGGCGIMLLFLARPSGARVQQLWGAAAAAVHAAGRGGLSRAAGQHGGGPAQARRARGEDKPPPPALAGAAKWASSATAN